MHTNLELLSHSRPEYTLILVLFCHGYMFVAICHAVWRIFRKHFLFKIGYNHSAEREKERES